MMGTAPPGPAGIDDIVNGAYSATGLWASGWNDAINQANGRERVAANQLSMVSDTPPACWLPSDGCSHIHGLCWPHSLAVIMLMPQAC